MTWWMYIPGIILLVFVICDWLFMDRPAQKKAPYVCPHNDSLCDRYGCPDDPNYVGDMR